MATYSNEANITNTTRSLKSERTKADDKRSFESFFSVSIFFPHLLSGHHKCVFFRRCP